MRCSRGSPSRTEVTSKPITASAVAWYAAAVATTAAIVSVLTYLRDRSSLKLTISQGFIGDTDTTYVFLTAVNRGRRPVTLAEFGLGLATGKKLVFPNTFAELSHDLPEGQSFAVHINRAEIEKSLVRANTTLNYAFVRTATDKRYRTRRRLHLARDPH